MNGLILIVDDDPAIRMMLRMMLKLDGFAVQEAENGVDALKQIEMHPPDLLILDVMMPEMDGVTLCKILRGREETAVLPIIMLSGKVQPEAEREGLAAGANRYLYKPTPRSVLNREIASLLEEVTYAQ